ncbi:MAG: helix-hairpin-helix domain-containing protein [Actinomycetes bacterium]
MNGWTDSGKHAAKREWLLRLWTPAAARAAGVAVAVLLVILGWWWWQGQPRSLESLAPPASEVLVTGAPLTGAESSVSEFAPSETPITVHVIGRVRNPGIYSLPSGSRVAAAIEAAGGLSSGADRIKINLARQLSDGEQLRVRRSLTGDLSSAATGADSPSVGLININTADIAALQQLSGIGPVLAQRIVDWRETHGQFADVEVLSEVAGIGPVLLTSLRPLVTV